MLVRNRSGFSLAETMIAVFIVSVLTAIIYSNYMDTVHGARRVKAMNDLKTIGNSALKYHVDNGRWPDSVKALVPLYLEQDLLDPWGNSYTVRSSLSTVETSTGREFMDFFAGVISDQMISGTSEVFWLKIDSEI